MLANIDIILYKTILDVFLRLIYATEYLVTASKDFVLLAHLLELEKTGIFW